MTDMHTEEQLGWFFGCVVFAVALMFYAVAVTIAFATMDGVSIIGWMFGGAGWWLVGLGLIQIGKHRAEIARIKHLSDDRSCQ